MPLPELTDSGDLPLGVHRASLHETLCASDHKPIHGFETMDQALSRINSASVILVTSVVFGDVVGT